MDHLSFINISKEQQDLFIPPIDAFVMPAEKFKNKYKPQRIKRLNIIAICDTFEENISELIMMKPFRLIGPKIIIGCKTILYIQLEYINNELKHITERFLLTFVPRKEKRPPNPDNKNKRRKVKVKAENNADDDSSVLFLSQEINFDIKKELNVDENVEDKNRIFEIKEPEEDLNIIAASYFGPASKEEIQFQWDNVDGIPDLNKSKTTIRGKYGVFAHAEKQVLESLEDPTKPLPGVLYDVEGNFDDFPQRLSEALPKILVTPSKRKLRDQFAAESPSKRSRPENRTSKDDKTFPDDIINDEGNFADFTHRIGEALSEIPLTPWKRKSMNDENLIETPSKRSRRSLNKQLQEVKEEPLDDMWILPVIGESGIKKSKKKKKKPYLDREITISHSGNVHTKTVPMELRLIKPNCIVTPVMVLFQVPLSLFAGNRKFKPMNRLLLKRFQYVASHPPPPIKRDDKEFDRNTSDFPFFSQIEGNPSQVRAPPSTDNLGITYIKADPGEDLPPIEEARNDLQITEPVALDSKIKADEFPIENSEMDFITIRRPPDITDTIDPTLPTSDSLGQNVDTMPVDELEEDAFDDDDDDDPNWDEKYIYQRIKELCKGGVKITFGDLAPCAETKKINRILAFEYILKLNDEEKICLDQSDKTEVITIWMFAEK